MGKKEPPTEELTAEQREQNKKDFENKETFKERFKEACADLKTSLENRKQDDPTEEKRDWAWEYCKKAFDDVFNKKKPEDIDYLALHLMCYLGNWGMLRGSSKLPSLNYKALKPMVQEILKTRDSLYGKDLTDFSEKDALDAFEKLRENIKGNCEKLLCLEDNNKDVSDTLRPAEPSSVLPEDNNKDVSGTLVSKIMLGTMGFVPAYDNNVKGILHYLKTHFSADVKQEIECKKKNEKWEGVDPRSAFGGNFNKGSVASLACLFAGEDDFAKKIQAVTKDIKDINPCYTLARVVDYAMWYLYDKLPPKEDKNGGFTDD